MSPRTAQCSCGQLAVTCTAEPVRISVCHCLACQRRTGSVFSTNARFEAGAVQARGRSSVFRRTGDSGGVLEFHFCPDCGTTLWWTLASVPDVIAVAVGCFADPQFGVPGISVYEDCRHGWVNLGHLPAAARHR